MSFMNILRKNIGTIVAVFGFILLCVITFGDLGEIFSEKYWSNVCDNLLGISFLSIGLTFVQTAIRQGVAEQALQKGLNSERTAQKYDEHKAFIRETNDKQIYLPYFLQIYNKKHTKLRQRDYLVNNNFTSEKSLRATGNARLIKGYEQIRVHITAASIKWSTISITYDKRGRIVTLSEYRRQRTAKAVISSLLVMIGTTFITGGLFFVPSTEPLWQKFVKLFTYCIAIAVSAIFTVIKEYEKGAFGVPNDLDEINQIWHEFKIWEVPDWVIRDVENLNNNDDKEVEADGQEDQGTPDCGTDLQAEQEKGETLCDLYPDSLVSFARTNSSVLLFDDEEQCGECDGDSGTVGQGEIHGSGIGTEL